LCFKRAYPAIIRETKQAQDKDGRLYDSRAGMGSYYRYGPRRISSLTRQFFSWTTGDEVYVEKPKIHETALRRIKNNAHVYAPIGIPHDYEVVSPEAAPGGAIRFRIDELPADPASLTATAPESADQAQARVIAEREEVWPRVYFRAILYFLTLATTIFFVVFPFTGRGDPLAERTSQFNWISKIIRLLAGFLPSWASDWLASYAQFPLTFVFLVVLIGLLLFAGRRVASSINDEMMTIWRKSFASKFRQPKEPPSYGPTGAAALFAVVRSGWRYYLGPLLSAVVIVYLVFTLGNRMLFTAVDQAGLVCTPTPTEQLNYVPDAGTLVSFDASNLCFATGYKVGRLERFYVWTNPNPAELARRYSGYATTKATCQVDAAAPQLVNGDVTTDARGYSTFHNPEGWTQLSWTQSILHMLATPLRRYYSHPWFQPVARYGFTGNEVDFLEPDPDPKFTKVEEVVSPKVAGELFLYLNDAVLLAPRSYQRLYADNKGCISFFIKQSK